VYRASCPEGYGVLFSREWPGLAKSCNGIDDALIEERMSEQIPPSGDAEGSTEQFQSIKFKDDAEYFMR
jgi:hypothetical protein